MRITPSLNFSYFNYGVQNNQSNTDFIKYSNNLTSDVFQRTSVSNISFQAHVTNGRFLRNLSGIHDPYSGVIILNNKEMDQIKADIPQQRSARAKIKYLEPYKSSMLPVEKVVFEMLEQEVRQNRHTTLKEILSSKSYYAKQELEREQNDVFDKIKENASNLSERNKLRVYDLITDSKTKTKLDNDDPNRFKKSKFVNDLIRISHYDDLEIIEEKILELPESDYKKAELDNYYETLRLFENNAYNVNIKGKTPLDMILDLKAKYLPESLEKESEIEPLIDIAEKLPTAKNSINAFITEMSNKDDNAIAKRIVSESLGTVEHIVPDSKGGPNEAYNFIFVTKSRNEERSNMSMEKFMKRYPDIPKHCQEYINDITRAAEKNKLKGYEWYPYVIKDTFKEQMNTVVNISSYRISPQKAFANFSENKKKDYERYKKYFS